MATTTTDVLRGSLAAWRTSKHPRFAALAGWASTRLLAEAPRAALPTGTKATDVAAWQRTFEPHDALDVPRLLAAVGTKRSPLSTERVVLLATLNDARVVTGLLALLEAPPFRSGTAQPFFRACCTALAESGDPRVRPALEALSGRYKGIIETSVGDLIAALLARTARGLDQVKPAALPARLEKQAGEWEQLFEVELRGTQQRAGEKKVAARSDDELLAAIYAAPDDDAPRLVFADALTERGDLRGEFITLQIARAQGTATGPQRAREYELLQDNKRRVAWALPLSMGGEVTLARGFPSGLALTPREAKKVLGHEALRTLERLFAVREAPLKTALELLRSPQLKNLHHVGWLQERHVEEHAGPLPWPSIAFDFAPDRETMERCTGLRSLELARAPRGALLGGERLTALTLQSAVGFSPALFPSTPEVRTLRAPAFIEDWASLGPLRALPKLERLVTRNAPPAVLLEGSGLKHLECAWTRELELEAVVSAAQSLVSFTFSGSRVPAELQAAVLRLARERAFESLGLGLVRIDKPFTKDGVAELAFLGAQRELVHELLAGLGTEVAKKVVLHAPFTGPTQRAPQPPTPAELEHLRSVCPVPLELAWYPRDLD